MSESSEFPRRDPGLPVIRGRHALIRKVIELAHRCENVSRQDASQESEFGLLEYFGSTFVLTRRRESMRRGNTVRTLSYRTWSQDMDPGCEWTVA